MSYSFILSVSQYELVDANEEDGWLSLVDQSTFLPRDDVIIPSPSAGPLSDVKSAITALKKKQQQSVPAREDDNTATERETARVLVSVMKVELVTTDDNEDIPTSVATPPLETVIDAWEISSKE